jgi:hypothetical protein
MGSRIPASFRGAVTVANAIGTGLRKLAEAGTRRARFWRDLPLLAVILVFSVLLGLRAVGRLMRGRWALGFIGLAIVIPLMVFAFQPYNAWRATADNPHPEQKAPQALEQEGRSDDDAVDGASIQEWRKSVEEVLKEGKIGQQPVADRETGAGAVVARTEEKLPLKETQRTEPPRDATPPDQRAQEAKPTEQPMQEAKSAQPAPNARHTEPPMQDAKKQEGDADPLAGSPVGPDLHLPEAKEGPGSTTDLQTVKPEAAPFPEGREMGTRRTFRDGRHYHSAWSYRIRGAWSYRNHTTGVARMGPVLTYLGR